LGRLTLHTDEHTVLYIPEGCARSYQTLADGSEIVSFTSTPYDWDAATSARYGESAFGSNGRSPSR
jgi:dTDP-4-dehydrorhamnose 3,5-epimerase